MLTREPVNLDEAMDVLTAVAEIEEDEDLTSYLVGSEPTYHQRAVAWFEYEDANEALKSVRHLFKMVAEYLKGQDAGQARHTWATVAEAANRLDQLATLFHGIAPGEVLNLPEYHELKRVYRQKADIPEGMHWVKNDDRYELFYMKREDGTPFVSPALVDQIALECDFGDWEVDDPLIHIFAWHDRVLHEAAKEILARARTQIDAFYRAREEGMLASCLRSAVMALSMAANPDNMARRDVPKPALTYFRDFLFFFRQALQSRDYKRAENGALMDLAHLLGFGLYTHVTFNEELMRVVRQLIADGGGGGDAPTIGQRLWNDYLSLSKALERHPNGPLFKALDLLRDHREHIFDLLAMGNIPSKIGDLKFGKRKVQLLRVPSPTRQEFVNEAEVAEEFRAYLRARKGTHLLINVDEEGARSYALKRIHEPNLEVLRCDPFDVEIIIEAIQEKRPTYVSITCKDAIDLGMAASALLWAAHKILQGKEWTSEDEEMVWQMVFIPALLHRERSMLAEVARKLCSTLQQLER